eukprot:CAMPEP_0115841192 /NCGR_PEP_ID=MMETSP0287-20121206/7163_1 /TAXON_ID=412157 /ORGANISM="Chrysochromulina rotalis, Strain UIO044" /LENGTH=283 /DNA_ID=CAMNT_0003294833 /DNA_START=221 /DNA_END=1072 /DNA_ORIENTATION=+
MHVRPTHREPPDMDGTFLNASGQLSARNVQMAAELERRGVHFAIATGRPAAALQPLIDGIGLPSLAAITFNGACLQVARPHLPSTPLWQHTLDAQQAHKIVAMCDEHLGLGISYSTRSAAIFLARTTAQRRLLATYERLEGVPQDRIISSVDDLPASDVDLPLKILALTETPDAHAEEARRALQGSGVHVIAAEMHIEFVDQAVNKAAAIERLCEISCVPLTSVVAFGDAMNDVEMLGRVGLGVAMQNARDAVKAAADETCAYTNDQDGVARKCEELIAYGKL